MTDQERMEEIVRWFGSALGLNDHRIEVRHGWTKNGRDNGCAWISSNFPNVIVGYRRQTDAMWMHDADDLEATTVHELVHALTEPVTRVFEEVIALLPKEMKNAKGAFARQYDRALEHAIERVAWALVAVAHTDRSSLPPMTGGIVPRTDLPLSEATP